jgi:hypothetical protein
VTDSLGCCICRSAIGTSCEILYPELEIINISEIWSLSISKF